MTTIQTILKNYWGYTSFRPLQEDIIQSVLNGHDTLALLPTGGGKSICFQVPALTLDGLCLVISPLIALMKDQVEQLRKRGIAALAIYSSMHPKEIDIALDNCIYGQIKFLYVSPERLQTELFIERAKKMNITLLAIDEAHCISQWGYDFRPPYLQIASFRSHLPHAKLIALTASATELVQKDIQEKLQFKNPAVFKKTFARSNLSYSCLHEENKERRLLQILEKIKGTSIIYVRNRKKTKQVADFLVKNKISATYYHAGLSHEERSEKQDAWINDRVRVIVATNAFGMGIDKPNVRSVIHLDLPDNLESYYQKAGQAGRDEKKAYAVILFNTKDIDDLEKRITQEYPSVDFMKRIYQCLANYFQIAAGSYSLTSYDFDLDEFRKNFNLPSIETFYALKKLEEEGLIQLNESFYQPSQLFIATTQKELYTYQVAHKEQDHLIKTILRMYGGELFINFTSITEKKIAQQLKISVKDINKQLRDLHQQGLIIYQQQKDNPQLIFTTPRYDVKRLPIDEKKISERQKASSQRMKAMINYVQHTTQCRTLLILHYFDEKNNIPCKVCDICITKNKKINLVANYTLYQEKIKKELEQGPLALDKIIEKIKPHHEEDLLECIRWMIGNEEVVYNNNKLTLKK